MRTDQNSRQIIEKRRGGGGENKKRGERRSVKRNMRRVKPIRREGRTMHMSGGLGKSPAVISAILMGMLKWVRVSL